MKNNKLKSLAHEFAITKYNGVIDENKNNWPEKLKNASGAISKTAYTVGINDPEAGYQVISIEQHNKKNSYLVLEMSSEGAEINLWVKYDEGDWENYGPKEDGYWE